MRSINNSVTQIGVVQSFAFNIKFFIDYCLIKSTKPDRWPPTRIRFIMFNSPYNKQFKGKLLVQGKQLFLVNLEFKEDKINRCEHFDKGCTWPDPSSSLKFFICIHSTLRLNLDTDALLESYCCVYVCIEKSDLFF